MANTISIIILSVALLILAWAVNRVSRYVNERINQLNDDIEDLKDDIRRFNSNINFIERWNSIAEASEATGICRPNIGECCRGNRKHTKGYKWKYEEDYEEPKIFYWIDYDGKICKAEIGTMDRTKIKQIGNYFETREEAELAVRKLKAWKRLEDNGVVFDECFDRFGETHNQRDVVVFLFRVEAPDWGEKSNDKIEDDLDLLFSGGEDE